MSVPSNREEGETGDTVPEPNESSVSIRSLLNPAEPSPSPTAAAAAGSVSVSVSASSGVVHPSIVDLQVPFDTTGRPLTPDSQEGTDAGDDAAIHPSNPYLSVRTAPLLVPLAVPPDASQGRDNPSGDQLDQGPVSDAAPGLLPAAPIFTGDGTLESELREEELSDYQRYLYDSLHLVPDQHPYDSSSDSQSQVRKRERQSGGTGASRVSSTLSPSPLYGLIYRSGTCSLFPPSLIYTHLFSPSSNLFKSSIRIS